MGLCWILMDCEPVWNTQHFRSVIRVTGTSRGRWCMMPRYVLANKLYRGRLPEEFRDLTWIGERVCAKYSNTAIVTRLYQSFIGPVATSSLPRKHCTHEMNASSMVTVLPRCERPVERRVYQTVKIQT